jgi:hypothetical protein
VTDLLSSNEKLHSQYTSRGRHTVISNVTKMDTRKITVACAMQLTRNSDVVTNSDLQLNNVYTAFRTYALTGSKPIEGLRNSHRKTLAYDESQV